MWLRVGTHLQSLAESNGLSYYRNVISQWRCSLFLSLSLSHRTSSTSHVEFVVPMGTSLPLLRAHDFELRLYTDNERRLPFATITRRVAGGERYDNAQTENVIFTRTRTRVGNSIRRSDVRACGRATLHDWELIQKS